MNGQLCLRLTLDDAPWRSEPARLIDFTYRLIGTHSDSATSEKTLRASTDQLSTQAISRIALERFRAVRERAWITRFTSQLARLSHLPDNWDSYAAEPPNQDAVLAGQRILETLWQDIGRKPDRLAASAEGGIAISFFYDEFRASIECYNSREIVASIVLPGKAPRVWEVERDENSVREALHEISEAIGARPAAENVSERSRT